MTKPAPHNKHIWHIHPNGSQTPSTLPDESLSTLVAELDDETVTAIILGGSYARGDATPYRDVDLARFVKEPPERTQQKRFTYRDGRLMSIVTRTIPQYRESFSVPERAIFVVPGVIWCNLLTYNL